MRLSEWSAANDIMDDPQALADRYERDGCLLVRNAVGIAELAEVIEHTVAVVGRWGVGRLSATAPGEPPALRWTGKHIDAIDDEELDSARTLNGATEEYERLHESLQGFADQVCAGPMFLWGGGNLRLSLPDDPAYVTSPHVDGYALSSTGDYRRIWVALSDIPFGDNGLGVALGSHRAGPYPYRPLEEYRKRPSTFWKTGRGGPRSGIGPELVDDWHSAEMHPGDAIVFSNKVVHRGLPATSDRIRVALTVTSCAQSSPKPGPATFTSSDYDRVRRIRELGGPLGLTEGQVMKVRADLMMSGLEVNEATVGEALAGDHAGWFQRAT